MSETEIFTNLELGIINRRSSTIWKCCERIELYKSYWKASHDESDIVREQANILHELDQMAIIFRRHQKDEKTYKNQDSELLADIKSLSERISLLPPDQHISIYSTPSGQITAAPLLGPKPLGEEVDEDILYVLTEACNRLESETDAEDEPEEAKPEPQEKLGDVRWVLKHRSRGDCFIQDWWDSGRAPFFDEMTTTTVKIARTFDDENDARAYLVELVSKYPTQAELQNMISAKIILRPEWKLA